jgi:hypothetical protein
MRSLKKYLIVIIVILGTACSLGSCASGLKAFNSTLDRHALSLEWMHRMGYLTPPPPGTDSAFDLIPDWRGMVSELHETNLSASFAFLGSTVLTLGAFSCVLVLAWMAWPGMDQADRNETPTAPGPSDF